MSKNLKKAIDLYQANVSLFSSLLEAFSNASRALTEDEHQQLITYLHRVVNYYEENGGVDDE